MSSPEQAKSAPTKPTNAAILRNLQAGKAAEEMPGLRREMVENPQDIGISYLIALAWNGLGRGNQGLKWLKRSLAIAPGHPHVLTSYAHQMLEARNVQAAHEAFHRAVEANPNFAAARYQRALLELEGWHFERGWRDYEARFLVPSAPAVWREHHTPVWGGAQAPEGKLLIWGEQSPATQIMLASVLRDDFIPPDVVFECDPSLVPLFERSFSHWEVHPMETPPSQRMREDDIAAHIPLGRLCGLARPSFESFPTTVGYLSADSERSIDLMLDLANPARRTIGLAWRTNIRGSRFKLADLKPLLGIPDITWVSLESRDAEEEIAAVEAETGVRIRRDHGIDVASDLDGLAALISACELVVTADSLCAHLAGALGRTVWTMIPDRHYARWYWFSRHLALPSAFPRWYPTMRLAWRRDHEDIPAFQERLVMLMTNALAADPPENATS